MAESKNPERHARQDLRLLTLGRFRLGLFAILLMISVLLGGSYAFLGNPGLRPQAQQAATPSPTAPSDDALKQLHATENAVLTTYGWVDRQKGLVRIPIDRAMELLLQRGLPARPSATP